MNSNLLISAIIISFAILISCLRLGVSIIDPSSLDNVTLNFNTNDLNISGDLNVSGTPYINEIYGTAYNYTEGGYDLDISTSGLYYNISVLSCGYNNEINCSDSSLIILIDGKYSLSAHGSFQGGNGGEYGFGISVNNDDPEDDRGCYNHFNGINTHIPVAITSCVKDLKEGDVIRLVIDDENAPTQDVNIQIVNLFIKRLSN